MERTLVSRSGTEMDGENNQYISSAIQCLPFRLVHFLTFI